MVSGPVVNVYLLSSYTFRSNGVKMEKGSSVADHLARMKQNYLKDERGRVLLEDVHNFFKDVWAKSRQAEEERVREDAEWPQERGLESETAPEDTVDLSRKPRTTANSNALKVTCELLRLFISEAIQRAGLMTEIEGLTEIDDSHLWRIVSQLMHDF